MKLEVVLRLDGGHEPGSRRLGNPPESWKLFPLISHITIENQNESASTISNYITKDIVGTWIFSILDSQEQVSYSLISNYFGLT